MVLAEHFDAETWLANNTRQSSLADATISNEELEFKEHILQQSSISYLHIELVSKNSICIHRQEWLQGAVLKKRMWLPQRTWNFRTSTVRFDAPGCLGGQRTGWGHDHGSLWVRTTLTSTSLDQGEGPRNPNVPTKMQSPSNDYLTIIVLCCFLMLCYVFLLWTLVLFRCFFQKMTGTWWFMWMCASVWGFAWREAVCHNTAVKMTYEP